MFLPACGPSDCVPDMFALMVCHSYLCSLLLLLFFFLLNSSALFWQPKTKGVNYLCPVFQTDFFFLPRVSDGSKRS